MLYDSSRAVDVAHPSKILLKDYVGAKQVRQIANISWLQILVSMPPLVFKRIKGIDFVFSITALIESGDISSSLQVWNSRHY